MIDQQTVRVAGLNNRVPTEVLLLQVIGSAIAMFLLGLHVGVLGRSLAPLMLAAGLVTMLLFVTFDLDRPTRGFITIPDTPLAALRESMDEPPAARPPTEAVGSSAPSLRGSSRSLGCGRPSPGHFQRVSRRLESPNSCQR